jgi:FkbM family methyltransferase
MNTSTRIFIASVLSRAVVLFRNSIGLKNSDIFLRNGIFWDLDLSQGIDFSVFLFGAFEPETVASYSSQITKGNTVLDIGANIGAHSLKLAELVGETGRVLCYEPTDYAFGKLQRNFKLNPSLQSRATCIQAFLGDGNNACRPDSIPSSWSLVGQANDKLHPIHFGTYNSLDKARETTIGESMIENGVKKVDFVKLDVDGFELPILRGAEEILNKDRPCILMEFAPYIYEEHGYTLHELAEFLQRLGYECRDLKGRKIGNREINAIPTRGSINVLMAPIL